MDQVQMNQLKKEEQDMLENVNIINWFEFILASSISQKAKIEAE